MIDRYTQKEILEMVMNEIELLFWTNVSLSVLSLIGIYLCIQHLNACLRDHAAIYKKLNRISGDLPE